MSFVNRAVAFVMNMLSWPEQALFCSFVAAEGLRLGQTSDDLGNHRPASLFVALWVHVDATSPRESGRPPPGSQISNFNAT